MKFKTYEVIDASRGSARLRVRLMLRVSVGSFRVNIPITPWRACGPFHRGYTKRYARHHCDMCAKYQGWVD